MKRVLFITGLLSLMAMGCETTLETGYKPNPLNATDAQRRAYYAPPFSPEAKAGQQDQSSLQVQPQGSR